MPCAHNLPALWAQGRSFLLSGMTLDGILDRNFVLKGLKHFLGWHMGIILEALMDTKESQES